MDNEELEIHAQAGTTVRVLDGIEIQISQEDPNAHHGISEIVIRGKDNLDLLIRHLVKCRETLA